MVVCRRSSPSVGKTCTVHPQEAHADPDTSDVSSAVSIFLSKSLIAGVPCLAAFIPRAKGRITGKGSAWQATSQGVSQVWVQTLIAL